MTVGFSELAAIRLGFGLSPRMAPPQDTAAVLANVASATVNPQPMATGRASELQTQLRGLRQARKRSEADRKAFQAFNKQVGQMAVRDLQARIARAVDDPVGFGERLVQFWADHFTVSPNGAEQIPLAMAFVDEAIRPHVNGRFADMFVAADTHPMMLVYLNQNASRGPNSPEALRQTKKKLGLNENLAREAMELHSMGVGAPYTQQDVRELAELLTGLSYDFRKGFAYRPQFAEPGAETVLGTSYGGMRRAGIEDIRAAMRDIARRPETAQYLSRKLAVHFFSDNPSPDLVDAMAATWRASDGDLPQVYRVMVEHPEMAATFRQKVRQPFDYVAAGFRALGVSGKQVMALDFPQLPGLTYEAMVRMGQRWMRPIGPDGWSEDTESWIVPQQMAGRIGWALSAPSRVLGQSLPDPRELLTTALGGTHSEGLAWAVPKAESRAEGVALVLASADFIRR